MSNMKKLIRLSAREVVDLLTKKEVSPLELIDIALERIKEVEGLINALPTLCVEKAKERAKTIMKNNKENNGENSWLAGLPIAVKDLTDVAGVKTTYGSPIFANYIPKKSEVIVQKLEECGAVVLAKSNTPEFGAGANTFNEVFGKTANPWDTSKTCGGSSGGSAAALAAGEIWLATGSDLGGSLRTPASFCSVVGLRPSFGRVAQAPSIDPFDTLAVEGPMARNVGDIAFMLDAICGNHIEDPRSMEKPTNSFSSSLNMPLPPGKIAFSPDLGGITPVNTEVAEICRKASLKFEEAGVTVEEASPDFRDAGEIFQTLRAVSFAAYWSPLLEKYPSQMKQEVIWNIEKGLALKGDEISWAIRARGNLYNRVAQFFQDYDFLLCPAAIVPPYDINQRYVENVNGHQFDNYVDWLLISAAITLTSCPSLSLPCGFTREGLPVGLQIIGKPRGEKNLLQAAARLEEVLGIKDKVPINPINKEKA